jgi:hypothetical protein
VLDFDIGPIDVSGHVVLDAIAALVQTIGPPAVAVPPRIGSGAAQKDKLDEIVARLEAGEPVTDEEIAFLVQEMVVTAFAEDPLGVATEGLPAEITGLDGLTLELSDATELGPAGNDNVSNIPEPGTLGLLAMLAGGLAAFRTIGRGKAPWFPRLAI